MCQGCFQSKMGQIKNRHLHESGSQTFMLNNFFSELGGEMLGVWMDRGEKGHYSQKNFSKQIYVVLRCF